MHAGLYVRIPKEKGYFEALGVDGRMMLNGS
jgi:hypothetical protein